MIFCNNISDYYLKRKSYIGDYYIGGATFGTFNFRNMLSPNTPSSIDKSKYVTYKKMHQEYLERTRIAHNYSTQEKVYTIGFINGKIKERTRDMFNYGHNNTFGYLDTTGTASGSKTYLVKNKAITELIEKNDMIVMWYKMYGEKVVQNYDIKKLVNSIGFQSREIYIFACKAISNVRSFCVFLFENRKIIATGVSCDMDEKRGLKQALLEAKLIESFRENSFLFFSKLTLSQHEEMYNRVKLLNGKFSEITYEELSKKEIKFDSWIEEIEIVVLNTRSNQDWITIRALSKELLNAIPQRKILLDSVNKKIFQIYNITKEDLETIAECNIV